MTNIKPGLFAQAHNNSSRDYTNPKVWGKNQFKSSFPASLVAYMHSKGIKPVYICTDANNDIIHKYISGEELYGINPLAENAFYDYEASYSAFDKFYTGDREKIDLVMIDSNTSKPLVGLEIKLTALPDNTTKNKSEEDYSCEIVVRSPTICYLACTICQNYEGNSGRETLKRLIESVPKINHWEDTESVLPHYQSILNAIMAVSKDLTDKQTPLIMQPVWKTKGNKGILAEDCLDVFVWSNLAAIQMFTRKPVSNTEITRFMRSTIWLYRILFEYVTYGQFDYVEIVKRYAYETNTDKAFALPGNSSHSLLSCAELTHPRISKHEIKNIILGGGQNFLSPERRFDAVLVNSPELFD